MYIMVKKTQKIGRSIIARSIGTALFAITFNLNVSPFKVV